MCLCGLLRIKWLFLFRVQIKLKLNILCTLYFVLWTIVPLCVWMTLWRAPLVPLPLLTKFHQGTSAIMDASPDSRPFSKPVYSCNELRVTGIICNHRVNHFDGAFLQGVTYRCCIWFIDPLLYSLLLYYRKLTWWLLRRTACCSF